MKQIRNRRTLKKRIRRAMSLSSFITVLILSGLFIYLIVDAAKRFAVYQAETVCQEIQKEINSERALRILGITDIEQLDLNNQLTKVWIHEFDKYNVLNDISKQLGNVTDTYIQIEINNVLAYSNVDQGFEEVSGFFQDTEVELPLMNSNKQVGTVKVRVNPKLLMIIAVPVFIIVGLSIIALIISKIASMFLTIPIINPINQLEKKVKAMAEGDQETAMNTQLTLKRPLREIESLVDSTNGIMKKLQGYNDQLEHQKEALENQNAELEVQNDELIKSKVQIQEQQVQLIQSEKMASIGLLTAAITHEINTPIGAINSNAQIGDMLLNQLVNHPLIQTDEELGTMFWQLKEVNDINLDACSRIIEIIKSLKGFSRLDQADFQEANINEGIKSVLVLTNNLLKRRIIVHEDYGNIPLVKCFPGQLNQVFMNIIVNASQAIEGEGEIFIRTFVQDSYLYVTMKDTGAGIEEENLMKIFDPGFTTKGVGIGLGLGLYISYNIIQKHNGGIDVVSEVGKGTEFIIKIPIYNDRT